MVCIRGTKCDSHVSTVVPCRVQRDAALLAPRIVLQLVVETQLVLPLLRSQRGGRGPRKRSICC
jgi:hypothetical protein